jgi:hypothetical protein
MWLPGGCLVAPRRLDGGAVGASCEEAQEEQQGVDAAYL